MQTADQIEALSPLNRLALAYAPSRCRDDWLTMFLLDSRIAAVVRQSREPVLAQIRLAWWRERLNELDMVRGHPEPLLGRIARMGPGMAAGMTALVDGWEALLSEPPLADHAILGFAEGRAEAVSLVAARHGACSAQAGNLGQCWALADLALHLGDPAERSLAMAMLEEAASPAKKPGRVLRPIAVLAGLSMRALSRGEASALESPGALITGMRLGLLGR